MDSSASVERTFLLLLLLLAGGPLLGSFVFFSHLSVRCLSSRECCASARSLVWGESGKPRKHESVFLGAGAFFSFTLVAAAAAGGPLELILQEKIFRLGDELINGRFG